MFSCICFLLFQGSVRPPPSSPATKPLDPETDVSATPQIPAPSPENRDHHCALLEKTEAERDDSQTCLPSSSSIRGEGEGQRQSGVVESTAGSSSVWSSVELDMNYTQSHKGILKLHTKWSHVVCVCRRCFKKYCLLFSL